MRVLTVRALAFAQNLNPEMPLPYSRDLRWRVIWVHLMYHTSASEIGELLGLSQRTVQRYLALYHQTGDIQARPRKNGPSRLLGDHEQLLIFQLIIREPGIYLHEIQERLHERLGARVSLSTLSRTLKFMGCTRQVIRHIAIQRDDELRAKFMANISMYDPSMFVWVDESGCDRRNSIRKYGYSVRGIRPVEQRLLVRGVRYSAIPVMSIEAIHDVYITEGTTDGQKFSHFIREYLLPQLLPFNGSNVRSIVIMDNAAIHHVDQNVQLIESTGAKVIFLPPYSPDLNPLEIAFSKIKALMKENDKLFQTTSAPKALLTMAFSMITCNDCLSFSKHCGYL